MDNATNPNPAPMKVTVFEDLKPRHGIPFSRQQIRNMVAAGQFPVPMKIGIRANGWIDGEIDAWLIARAAARPAA